MKGREEGISTTVTHRRKGNCLAIQNVTGIIRIVAQTTKSDNSIQIEATGSASAHDQLKIHGSKGEVTIAGASAELLTPVNLQIAIPSGISVRLKNIGGSVAISETIGVLIVINHRSCQIFTELLYDAILHIGAKVDLKIKRLIGHCDIIANAAAQVEIREALISTLSVNARERTQINIYGSARFAKLNMEQESNLHVEMIEELIEQRCDKHVTLSHGRISSPRKAYGKQRYLARRQASTDMILFANTFAPSKNISPLITNA